MAQFTKIFEVLSNAARGITGSEFTRSGLINAQLSRSASIYDNLGSIGATTTTNKGRVDSNQGTGEQVNPSTTNKVPRIYGQVTTGGIITDAVYTNTNNTLTVCLVLSEYNGNYDWQNSQWTSFNSGLWEPTGNYSNSWSIIDVYRNDQKLVFGDGTAPFKFHDVHYLERIDDQTQTDINTKISMWAYAGGSAAANQIFPTTESSGGGSLGNAWDFMPGWTSSNTMTDLVFVIMQIDYDDPLDLKEFGEYKITVRNSIGCYYDLRGNLWTQPAVALEDYLTSTRYGLGIDPATIDSGAWDQRWTVPNTANNTEDSFRDWLLYSFENIVYKTSDGSSGLGAPNDYPIGFNVADRHQINAIINTQDSAETNINTICQAGNAYLRFDHKKLKWTVIHNHDFDDAEIAAAFELTADNILSSIDIQSTDLFSMFNSVEAKFPNYLIRDEADIVIVNTPAADKQPNEPFNQMSVNYVGVNDRFRAAVQAEIDLKQSRSAQTVSLTADYSAMQLDVGDLVLLTLPEYGFNKSYFRVMRTTEQEGVDGVISVNLLLRYTDRLIYREGWFQDTVNDIDGVNYIPNEVNDGATWTLTEFVDANYATDTANYYDAAGTLINTTTWGVAEAAYINETASPRDFIGFKWSGLDTNNTLNIIDIVAQNGGHRVGVPAGREYVASTTWLNSTGNTTIDKDRLISGDAYTFALQFKDNNEYLYKSIVVNIPSKTYTDSQVTGGALTNTYGANTHVEEVLGNIVQTNTGSYHVLFEKKHDITQMPKGMAGIQMVTTVAGSGDVQALSDIKFHPSAEVLFVSKTGGKTSFEVPFDSLIEYKDVGNGITNELYTSEQVFTSHLMNAKFSTDPDFYNLSSDWYPTRVTIRANGYNTIPTTGAFNNTEYELFHRDAYDRLINQGWYPE